MASKYTPYLLKNADHVAKTRDITLSEFAREHGLNRARLYTKLKEWRKERDED